MANKQEFKVEFTLGTVLWPIIERRKEITAELMKKYPNKIPIVCQKAHNSKLPSLAKDKYVRNKQH